MSETVEIDQALGLVPRGLVHPVEISRQHQPPRPAVLVRHELARVLVQAGVAGQDLPGTGLGPS